MNICGAAGTGKTATLQELKQGLSEAGRVVFAVAPTTSAVEELRKVGFEEAVTVERLLQDPSLHRSVQGNVLIADEAGMLSARQMSELLRISEQHSVRIVFGTSPGSSRRSKAGRVLISESGKTKPRTQSLLTGEKRDTGDCPTSTPLS